MSFILDALKKSEIERQRQTVPGLMDVRTAQRRVGLPMWAVLLGALLAINVVVLLVVLWRNSLPGPVAAPAASARRTAAPASTPALDHFSPLDSAPVYAPEIPVSPAPPAPAPAPTQTRTQPAVVAPLAPPLHPAKTQRRPEPLLSDEDAKSDNDEVLPSINELNLSGAQALPEMHLDVHVYATKPSDRFVYINMRKYHEGATLQEGPTLERIRRDGVVLNFQGLRFILPRQS
jgi:general secretion pathway protein B